MLNGAGFLILWRLESLDRGLVSLATGVPVGLLATYTMPRASWHLWRDSSWTIAYVPRRDGWLVTLGGAL